MTAITSWLTDPNKRQLTLIIALAATVLMLYRSCENGRSAKAEAERDRLVSEQNMRAMQDSVRFEKNRAGDVESIKSAFISKLSDLEKTNADLYREIKSEVGTVKSLIKGQATAGVKDVIVSSQLVKYPDGITHGLKFADTKADTGFSWTIRGESRFRFEGGVLSAGTTTIDENTMRVRMVLGFKENDGNYEVFARSKSPNVKFDELDGTLIIPKKADLTTPIVKNKRFGLGVHLGFGVAADKTGTVKIGPQVGVGINYNLLKF